MVTFKKALANACIAAKLPVLHPHALRHTAATRWAWDHVEVPTMMALGGWKTPYVPLTVYAQSNKERMELAMSRTVVGAIDGQRVMDIVRRPSVSIVKSQGGRVSGQPDSNRRPSAPKADALPG